MTGLDRLDDRGFQYPHHSAANTSTSYLGILRASLDVTTYLFAKAQARRPKIIVTYLNTALFMIQDRIEVLLASRGLRLLDANLARSEPWNVTVAPLE